MALTSQQSLQLYGTPAYTGWGETEAMYDARNKGLSGGGASGGFNFDFNGEAKKAYDELGSYYDRILKESKGDLNKAMSRLVEDYDTGIRLKKEDVAIARQQLGIQQDQTNKIGVDNALARGIYQKSAYDPSGGYGIQDQAQKLNDQQFATQNAAIDTNLNRYTDAAGLARTRTETDLTEGQKRNEFNLEQSRRTEAGQMANERATRALTRYNAALI